MDVPLGVTVNDSVVRSAGSPAPVVSSTDHECDAIGNELLLSMLKVLVDAERQTASAVVLALMLGTGRGIIATVAVATQLWSSVTVTI